MTSNDNQQFVTVEVLRSELGEIKTEIRKIGTQLNELNSEIKVINENMIVNSTKIDDLYFFMGIGFAVVAIIVTFVGFIISLAPMFREMYRDSKKDKTGIHTSYEEFLPI